MNITNLSQIQNCEKTLGNLTRALKFIYSVRDLLVNCEIFNKYNKINNFKQNFKLNNEQYYKNTFLSPMVAIHLLLQAKPLYLKKIILYNPSNQRLSLLEVSLLYLEINILFVTSFIHSLNRIDRVLDLNIYMCIVENLNMFRPIADFSKLFHLDFSDNYQYHVINIEQSKLDLGAFDSIFYLNNKDAQQDENWNNYVALFNS